MRFMALPRYAMSLDANSIIDAWSDRHSPYHTRRRETARGMTLGRRYTSCCLIDGRGIVGGCRMAREARTNHRPFLARHGAV